MAGVRTPESIFAAAVGESRDMLRRIEALVDVDLGALHALLAAARAEGTLPGSRMSGSGA